MLSANLGSVLGYDLSLVNGWEVVIVVVCMGGAALVLE